MVAIDIDIITVINWLVAFGIPLLVGLIGRKVKDSLGRVILLLVLNAVQTGLGELVRAMQDGTTWSFGTWLFTLLGAIALSTGSYTGIWKPTGAAAAAQGKAGRDSLPDAA